MKFIKKVVPPPVETIVTIELTEEELRTLRIVVGCATEQDLDIRGFGPYRTPLTTLFRALRAVECEVTER